MAKMLAEIPLGLEGVVDNLIWQILWICYADHRLITAIWESTFSIHPSLPLSVRGFPISRSKT